MSNAIFAALSRQDGLLREMQVIANNVANANTTGFKSNHVLFAEHVVAAGAESEGLSMGTLGAHSYDFSQGQFTYTHGQFDFAIQGDGFFVVETPAGDRLTRAGNFQLSADGDLIDFEGNPVLAAGGGRISIPREVTDLSIGADGTISANGEILSQIGVVNTEGDLKQESGTRFIPPEGGYDQLDDPQILQGVLEQSNVSSVLEITRLIEVQRAYEAGQTLTEKEDDRVSRLINTIRQL